MTTILTGILAQFWPYILAAFGGLALIIQQRRSAVKAERAKQAEREAEARDIADKVDNDVGALPPADARKELGKWSR